MSILQIMVPLEGNLAQSTSEGSVLCVRTLTLYGVHPSVCGCKCVFTQHSSCLTALRNCAECSPHWWFIEAAFTLLSVQIRTCCFCSRRAKCWTTFHTVSSRFTLTWRDTRAEHYHTTTCRTWPPPPPPPLRESCACDNETCDITKALPLRVVTEG